MLPPRTADLSGKSFGRLSVLAYAGKRGKNSIWKCECVCGIVKNILGFTLTNGAVKSCGCLQIEIVKARATHGQSNTREYKIWNQMWQRCTNPNDAYYAEYKNRRPPEEWRNFEVFILELGKRPTERHTLERVDNSKPYGPGNCVWATRRENNLNKENNINVEYRGVVKALVVWTEELNLPYSRTRHRIVNLKWSVQDSFERKPYARR